MKSRYILTPEIFDTLTKARPSASGEIQLTVGMDLLLQSQHMYALRFQGDHYDAGNALGLLKAYVELALQREDIGKDFMEFLEQLVD